jgi:hypothetical protein
MKHVFFSLVLLVMMTSCMSQQAGGSQQERCELLGGKYLDEFDECEGISQEQCAELGGVFNECASACRHDPNARFCTMQCVQVCSFR